MKRRRPLIGINCKLTTSEGDPTYALDRLYVDAVWKAGGTPLLMPFFRSRREASDFLERLDGVLMTGGPDVNPRRWGEAPHPKTRLLHPDREKSDFWVLEEVLRRDLPLLAVCCACQELNVALGGSLHQHLPDLPGVRRHAGGVRHPVDVTPGSKLREILGGSHTGVNSWHHQACREIGRGLSVAAYAPDGVVEAVESSRHRFVVGVQWHPERMSGDRRQRALFRALVAEAGRPP
ncbi:MAG TPA: gamma-glutamyl-gamma-aminobutyrate hydrolase family protein [Planctomycetota bacterium]|nr:gamma-glutamyl-gamma-aminobutyrate hydrolase family protein [Planctomycetota bacterium]